MASLKRRGRYFYIQYYLGGEQRRISTDTDNLQLAKEKLRQFESAQARGEDNFLPTRTPIADVVTAYVAHIRAVKTAKSAQTDTSTNTPRGKPRTTGYSPPPTGKGGTRTISPPIYGR